MSYGNRKICMKIQYHHQHHKRFLQLGFLGLHPEEMVYFSSLSLPFLQWKMFDTLRFFYKTDLSKLNKLMCVTLLLNQSVRGRNAESSQSDTSYFNEH